MIDGKPSWLDDCINPTALPTCGTANDVAVNMPVAASAKPMAERASDPLGELFE